MKNKIGDIFQGLDTIDNLIKGVKREYKLVSRTENGKPIFAEVDFYGNVIGKAYECEPNSGRMYDSDGYTIDWIKDNVKRCKYERLNDFGIDVYVGIAEDGEEYIERISDGYDYEDTHITLPYGSVEHLVGRKLKLGEKVCIRGNKKQ